MFFAATLLGVTAAQAFPGLHGRQEVTSLSTLQIGDVDPYTYYASAGYCDASETLAWSCGANCQANPTFKPVASGGDGGFIQYWYVGYDPNLATVIVAHQGTNPSEILPLITDIDFTLKNLDPTLFPGISTDIKCHSGFADDHAQTAKDILAAVQQTMSTYNTTHVTLVGHSLGAALSLLDSMYLPLWLPSGTSFQTICYGLPRVGNRAFANYIDANLHLIHINNKKDPIPICPGMFLGFAHPGGEVHVEDSGDWADCPGQDNPSTQCIVGEVQSILDGNLNDHGGPYNGIEMGC